jgi:HD-GYP domain-containing protein (c-di-GMP phosphodiesterase class II)
MRENDVHRWTLELDRVRERVKSLVLLSQLGQILNSTLDYREVWRKAVEAATQLMKAEAGSLLLTDEGENRLYFEVALGDREEEIKIITLNLGEGIAGWVAMNGKPLIANHPEEAPHFLKEVDERTKFKTRNLICVPVKVKEKVIGVLEAINKKENRDFDEEDLYLFTSLADQVAIALDNARLYQELDGMFFQIVESLADAIGKRDSYTGEHIQRVTLYCLAIAKYLPLRPPEKKWLRIASALHDLGKIGIGDEILRKSEPLNPEELMALRRHSEIGAMIIEHIPQLKEVIPGVKYHHEQIDGKGYPKGLIGKEIPLLAKIVAVADTFDAMTTGRPYRKAMEKEMAIEELRKCSGIQFDKEVVEAFLQAYQNGEI